MLIVSFRPVGFLFVDICVAFVFNFFLYIFNKLSQLLNNHFSFGTHPKLRLPIFGTTADLSSGPLEVLKYFSHTDLPCL